MIEMVLAPADLGRVRFGHSPVRELVSSLRSLQDPARRDVYATWRRTLAGRLDGLDMELLRALSPVSRHAWSFLGPVITTQWADLDDELDRIAATPPEAVRAEIDEYTEGKAIPEPLRALRAEPERQLKVVVAEMHAYWQAAIAPVWSQVRALTVADLVSRMELFSVSGLAGVLGQLHAEVSFRGDRLYIDKPHHCVQRYDLNGRGVLLVPCAFTWPTLMVACCGAEQPSLIYPTRGAATVGEEVRDMERVDPLEGVIGRGRASILAALAEPRSTSGLAVLIDVSPSAVSQHLKVLKAAGLVTSLRRGRHVLYQRTAAAAALLQAAGGVNDSAA
jgi:DNA-binding transcriptional ArsR family regulator